MQPPTTADRVDKIELAEWGIIIMISICGLALVIEWVDEKGWFNDD